MLESVRRRQGVVALLGFGMNHLLHTVTAMALLPSLAQGQWTSQVNRDHNDQVVVGRPFEPDLSGDGRFVVFSQLGSLIPGDASDVREVYLRDRVLQTTEIVSVAHDGSPAEASSLRCSISADGRFVVFASGASNLVPGGTNGQRNIFLRDRELGTTTRLSVGLGGAEIDQPCLSPVISADGRYVAFDSYADNLVFGDTNGERDVFFLDRETGAMELVSLSTAGVQGNSESWNASISDDGRYVAFQSSSNNLDGLDGNGRYDVFLHDRLAGTTTLVSRAITGDSGNCSSAYPHLSAGGEVLLFSSCAHDLLIDDQNGGINDVFLYDIASGQREIVSRAWDGAQGDDGSVTRSIGNIIDEECRYVCFTSLASNLVPGDTNATWDIFVRDRVAQTTRRVSVHSNGTQADFRSEWPAISNDGRHVVFASWANTIVDDHGLTERDVFVHSAWLHLTANGQSFSAGEPLELSTWRGLPGSPTLVFVVGVDGTPLSLPLLRGSLDTGGKLQLGTVVPSGLEGMGVQLKAFGLAPTGSLEATQELSLSFE